MQKKGYSIQNLCLEKQICFYNAHCTHTQQEDGILLCRRPIDIILYPSYRNIIYYAWMK